MNNFSQEEIRVAKNTKNLIVKENIPELKAIYMAGEICMWDELQSKQNLHTDKDLRSISVDFAYYIHTTKQGDCSHEKHKEIFDEWYNEKFGNTK